MDLLEHEMSVAAFLRSVRIPGDALDLYGAGHSSRIQHLHPVGINPGDLPILHADHIPGIRKEGWNIRG